MTELNPLSDFAIGVLRALAHHDMERHKINPGVIGRLGAEKLIEHYEVATQSASWKTKRKHWVKITDAGRAVLAAIDQAKQENP